LLVVVVVFSSSSLLLFILLVLWTPLHHWFSDPSVALLLKLI
jgi:hypothetical protein